VETIHLNHSGAERSEGSKRAAKLGVTRWSERPDSMISTIRQASQVAVRVGVRLRMRTQKYDELVAWKKNAGRTTHNWLSVSRIALPICVATLVGHMTEVRTRGALYLFVRDDELKMRQNRCSIERRTGT
jgi:hypothetical protein